MEQLRPTGFRILPPVVKNLLIINGLFFLATLVFEKRMGVDLTNFLGLHYPLSVNFRLHQLVTYMFMHDPIDFGHIFFNMLSLWMFGNVLEQVWGSKKFIIYYIITGVGAAVFQLLVLYIQITRLELKVGPDILTEIRQNGYNILLDGKNYADQILAKINLNYNSVTVGASGAIFGILMGFGFTFPNAQLMLLFPPIPIKGKYIALVALIIGVIFDYRGNVAHFAHLGGMLIGYFLLLYWKKR